MDIYGSEQSGEIGIIPLDDSLVAKINYHLPDTIASCPDTMREVRGTLCWSRFEVAEAVAEVFRDHIFPHRPDTGHHSVDVANLGHEIARELPDAYFDKREVDKDTTIEGVRIGGLFHDIGKIGIDPNLITSNNLSARKKHYVRINHALLGLLFTEGVGLPQFVRASTAYHHQYRNNFPYLIAPDGYQMPPEVPIISAADITGATLRPRPGRGPLDATEVTGIIEKKRELYGPELTDTTIRMIASGQVFDVLNRNPFPDPN